MIIIYCLSSSAKTGSPKGQGELWENFGIALGEVRESSPRALPRPLEKHFWSKRFPRALPELSQSSPSAVPDPLEKHFWRKRFSIDLPELSQSSPRAVPARVFFQPKVPKVWNSYFLNFFKMISIAIIKIFKKCLKLFSKCFKLFSKDFNSNYQNF